MKLSFLIFLLVWSSLAYSQLELNPDTVLYSDRMGGSLDTFDLDVSDLPTSFDGGNSFLSESGLSSFRLYQDLNSRYFQGFTSIEKIEFSAIPHLGFAYSFGSQSSQFLSLKYSQAFSDKILLNIHYDRRSGSGFIRRTEYDQDNVRLRMQRNAQRYSFDLSGSFQANKMQHAGGVQYDTIQDSSTVNTIITDFGMEFLSVNKENAQSLTKLGFAHYKGYLNFSSDSINHIGFVHGHDYDIVNRVYTEYDDNLSSIYDTILIDADSTRDQFNFARIKNSAGFYFLNKKSRLYLDAQLQSAYWRYQNLGSNRDTNEFNFISSVRIAWGGFRFDNSLRFNLIGAFNEWSEQANISYINEKIKFQGFLSAENLAPDPLIRFYSGNHYDYQLADINKQFWLRTGGNVKWRVIDSLLSINVSGDFNSLTSTYLFNGASWSDSLSSFNFASFGVGAEFSIGPLRWYPKLVYSIDENNFLPELQAYSRLLIKGKLFKAKKLEAALGFDASYISGFTHRVYNPSMDVFDWYASRGNAGAISNLHAFTSFAIDEFRFYFRYENIASFWNDRSIEEIQAYPISGTRMRIGITWDFFN